MLLIVWLGNIGDQYQQTRHNVGFMMIDLLAQKLGITMQLKPKFKAWLGKGQCDWEKILLLKPTTFMNLSGESVQLVTDFYKIFPDQLRVVYDDISLNLGQARIRLKGSAGGHNGMRSIIKLLGTENFVRLKIGINNGYKGELTRFVLGKFLKEEQLIIDKVLDQLKDKIWKKSLIAESFNFVI